jgi:tetrahydromethanopterin S-methyltransferase subunit G
MDESDINSIHRRIDDLQKHMDAQHADLKELVSARLSPIEGDMEALLGRHDKLEERVSSLESWQIRIAGGFLVLGVLIKGVWDHLSNFFGWF